MSNLGLDQVLVLKLDPATATLTPGSKVKPGAGARHNAFRRDGKFVYVINEIACTMTAFAYDDARGTLQEIQTLSTLPPDTEFKPENAAAEVFVHPCGEFLYGSNRGHNSLIVYAIEEKTGRLSPTGNSIEVDKPVCVICVPVE